MSFPLSLLGAYECQRQPSEKVEAPDPVELGEECNSKEKKKCLDRESIDDARVRQEQGEEREGDGGLHFLDDDDD